MSKKFELTSNLKVLCGKKLFQIRALISFGDVKKGQSALNAGAFTET